MESSDNVVCDAPSNISLLLSTHQLLPSSSSSSSDPLNSFWLSNPSLQGDSVSMVNFQNSASPYIDKEEDGNEEYDPWLHHPEKKRRLTTNQVEFLEKSFEVDNKLEPERKLQLAKDLDLLPRQVAIWFQNRRARYKTKQLEKDYDSLKASYDKLKVDYDRLCKENEELKNEVQVFKEKVLNGGKEQAHCDPNNSVEKANVVVVPVMGIRQEDANSAKSGVFDSDSPNCGEGKQASLFDPVDSFRVFEQEQPDFSQDEEANLCRIVPPTCLPKLKIESFDDLNADSCNLSNSNDDLPFWCWSY